MINDCCTPVCLPLRFAIYPTGKCYRIFFGIFKSSLGFALGIILSWNGIDDAPETCSWDQNIFVFLVYLQICIYLLKVLASWVLMLSNYIHVLYN